MNNMNMRVISIASFREKLDNVQPPLVERVRGALVVFLRAESQRVGEAFREQAYGEHAGAEAQEKLASGRAEENRKRLGAAERKEADLPSGSWTMGIVSTLCFVICCAAEYVFNSAVVPWLVSVPRGSMLGMALSMAPACAPVILDRVLVALFDVQDSWEAVKSAVLSPLNRRARRAVRIGFLATVGVLNLYGIWLLADSRAVASFVRNNPKVTSISEVQQRKIDQALLFLSMVITIDGALFYIFGLHELHLVSLKRRARLEFVGLSTAQESLDQTLSAAWSQLACKRRIWEEIDKLEQSAIEVYFADNMVELEKAAAQPAPPLSPRQVVEAKLGQLARPHTALGASEAHTNGRKAY